MFFVTLTIINMHKTRALATLTQNVKAIPKLNTVDHNVNLSIVDPIQRLYLKEQCILVDDKDVIIGSESKENCHLVANIKKGMIHRAFSVFLFNRKNELLMQERSYNKITFPGYLTNTCCSHPLFNDTEMTNDIISGVKNAAIRKLNHELGIKIGEITPIDLKYKARFYYKAISDGIWGENEMDYVFLVKKDVKLEPNAEEVKVVKYYTKEEIIDTIQSADSKKIKLSPWFKLIAQHFLYDWWDNLDRHQNDEELGDIHRLG